LADAPNSGDLCDQCRQPACPVSETSGPYAPGGCLPQVETRAGQRRLQTSEHLDLSRSHTCWMRTGTYVRGAACQRGAVERSPRSGTGW